MTAAVVGDAQWRWYYGNGAEGWGLRGGTYRYTGRARSVTVEVHAVRWTADTAVSGRMSWDQVSGLVHAWLTVTGPGGAVATVYLHYLDYVRNPVAWLSGRFGGRAIAASLPAP